MPHPEQPSYEGLAAGNAELTARVAELTTVVAEQAALIESLRAEVAALRRQAGRDSSNSSQPPSQDSPASEAKARARAGSRRARAGRPQGGQKGHPGAGLQLAARPDETRVIEPGCCGRCGADLAGAAGRIASRVQVFDIPAAALTVTEYQMMSCTCGCGQVTTAAAPAGVSGGPACYGPNVVAAATLLASTDVIGIERAADLMGALLRAPVSAGFGSRCLARLDAALTAAGFEDALKDALRASGVLGTDETPAPLMGGRQRGGLREPARVHGADHARLYRRRATITGCSADWTTTPRTGRSRCWSSSTGGASRSGRSCQRPITAMSEPSARSICGGIRVRWPDWPAGVSGRGELLVWLVAHRVHVPGQGMRVVGAALPQRPGDLPPFAGPQWLQDDAHPERGCDLGERAERGVDMAGGEQPAHGGRLGADRAGQFSLGQSGGFPRFIQLADDPADRRDPDRLRHVLPQELGVFQVLRQVVPEHAALCVHLRSLHHVRIKYVTSCSGVGQACAVMVARGLRILRVRGGRSKIKLSGRSSGKPSLRAPVSCW